MPLAAAVDDLHELLNGTATDPDADPAERIASLRAVRTELATLVGAADRYIGDLELQREGGAMHRARQFVAARAEATARGEAVADGLPPEHADSAGVMSHAQLDERQADGSLEESVLGLPTDPVLREAWLDTRKRHHAVDDDEPLRELDGVGDVLAETEDDDVG